MVLQHQNIMQSTFCSLIISVAGAFAGAWAAFLLNNCREKKHQFNKNIQTLIVSQYFLSKQSKWHKQLDQHIHDSQYFFYSKKTVAESKCDEDYWKSVTPFFKTFPLSDLSKLPLSFLLDEKLKGKDYLDRILGQNAAYDSVTFLLEQRNQLDPMSSGLEEHSYKMKVNESHSKLLNELTRELIRQNKNAIQDYESKTQGFDEFIQKYRNKD